MLTTRFTELVGCTVPIQQAGMGRLAGLPLAAAVADAGGLGQVSIGELADPNRVAQVLDETRRQTGGAIGANVLGPDPESDVDRELITVASSRVRVVDVFWADPDPALVAIVHADGELAGRLAGGGHRSRARGLRLHHRARH